MPISYDITWLPDKKYKVVRLSNSRKTSASPLFFTRADLENYLKDSVSGTKLKQALQTLDSDGKVRVEADLES